MIKLISKNDGQKFILCVHSIISNSVSTETEHYDKIEFLIRSNTKTQRTIKRILFAITLKMTGINEIFLLSSFTIDLDFLRALFKVINIYFNSF
jgi:hypothetical protein